MPEQCNAQIRAGDVIVMCRRPDRHDGVLGGEHHENCSWGEEGSLAWVDEAPGAVPHTEPGPVDWEATAKTAWKEIGQLTAERDRARADADVYRDALRWISEHPWTDATGCTGMKRAAREALEGVSRD